MIDFIFALGLFSFGYIFGHFRGWLKGYDDCSRDTMQVMDVYFDDKGKEK